VRGRLLSVPLITTIVTAIVIGWAVPAWAGGISSQYKTVHASESRGHVVIHARYVEQSDTATGSSNSGSGSSGGPICTYTPIGPTGTKLLGPGGAGPGAWYIPNCQFRDGYVGDPMPAVWIGSTPSTPAVNPRQLAQQAVADLALGGAQIEMSPPPTRPQIVNVQTWLWLSGAWRSMSATAAAGPVKATATAVPTKVVWDMGDGHSVTCYGPGTVYNRDKPASGQSTNCSYTYRTPSSAGPR